MTAASCRVVKVDTQVRAIANHLERMHLVCFPDFTVTQMHGDWWFAMADGVPIAFAGLWPSHRFPAAGYLCRAGVMPGHRGQGLQRRLIKVREKEAKRKQWTALYSDAAVYNPTSINNLFACGFRAFAPAVQWDGEDFVYVRKIIDKGVA